MKLIQWVLCALAMALLLPEGAQARELRVTATTFPIQQLLRQVTQGRDGLRVALLIPAQAGCPHDYMMTPADMRTLEHADVLVLNGLGMEDFLLDSLPRGDKAPKLIDTSAAVDTRDLLIYMDADGSHSDEPARAPHDGERDGAAAHGHDAPVEHDSAAHGQDGHAPHTHAAAGMTNPHLFASPHMLARMAVYLATELGKLDSEGAALYTENAQRYARELEAVAAESAALGKRLANRCIVTQHGVFDYLARDMGLEIVAVVQAHAGQEPSAAEIMRLAKHIRAAHAGAIFIEPQYSRKTGETLARESNVTLAVLDPAASGPENAPLDYTLAAMRANLKTLETTLGTRE